MAKFQEINVTWKIFSEDMDMDSNLDHRKNFDHLHMNKFFIIQGVLHSLLDM